jgi:hypothetical protein
MSDSLRERIAAVVARANDCWCEDCHVEPDDFDLMVADAVIAELGLRQETVYAWRNGRSRASGVRYVTGWGAPGRVPRSAEKLGLEGDGA